MRERDTNDLPRRSEVGLVMAINDGGVPPILAQKYYLRSSAFTPENLLREARRQKRITDSSIPEICVLDPDGDSSGGIRANGRRPAIFSLQSMAGSPKASIRLI
jgi:hypothetical protein